MKNFYIIFLLFLSKATIVSANTNCLNYGVIPYTNITDIEKSYKKWKEYLIDKIGKCINITYETSYSNLINQFSRNKLDMAFVGPFSYVLIKSITNVEPIVTGVTSDGFATYKSNMVVTKEVADMLGIKKVLHGISGMKTIKKKLEKFKKRWMLAFTDESSTSGYAVPNYYMKKVGLEPYDYFKKIIFVGSHDAAQLAVRNNIISIAFSADMFYMKLLASGHITKNSNILIWESDKIPKSPIIVKKDLSKKLKLELQEALIDMPKTCIPKIAKEIGYIKADEKNYKIIEDINNYLKKQ